MQTQEQVQEEEQGHVQAHELKQIEQRSDIAETAQLAAGPPLAGELPPAPALVEVEAAVVTAGRESSGSVCDGLSIPLTVEEVEQLRANLAAAAVELQADEHGSTGSEEVAGTSWVIVQQKNAQPVTDDPESPHSDKLREWV